MQNHNSKYTQRQEGTIRNLPSFFKKHLAAGPGQAEERRYKKRHNYENRTYYCPRSTHQMHIAEPHCLFSEAQGAQNAGGPDSAATNEIAPQAAQKPCNNRPL